jgi:hypothetical protein
MKYYKLEKKKKKNFIVCIRLEVKMIELLIMILFQGKEMNEKEKTENLYRFI